MEIYLILGYLGAVLIGLVLGLIGGGGSILTLPILVYLFGIEPVTATAYSLFIVGLAAVVGTLKNMRQQLVDFKTALIFALPAFIAVYVTRRYLVPALPDPLFSLGTWSLSKNVGIMVFFAVIMVLASVSMIRDRREEIDVQSGTGAQYNYPLIILEGLASAHAACTGHRFAVAFYHKPRNSLFPPQPPATAIRARPWARAS